MEQGSRNKAMVYLTTSVLGLFLLSVGLPGLHFEPGQAIPGAVDNSPSTQFNTALPAESNLSIPAVLRWLFVAAFVLLLLLLFIFLIKKTNFRVAALFLGGLAVFAGAAVLLNHLGPSTNRTSLQSPQVFEYQQPLDYNVAPIGEPPPGFAWVVMGLVLILVLGLTAWLMVRALRIRQPENRLAGEAEAALHAIDAGQDLQDVILRCYQQMALLVCRERGIEREDSATPREFEDTLIESGLPAEPIRTLTRLFEQARYGGKPCGDEERQTSVACLSALRDACLKGSGGRQ